MPVSAPEVWGDKKLWSNSCFSTVIQQLGHLTRRQATFADFVKQRSKASVKRTGIASYIFKHSTTLQ